MAVLLLTACTQDGPHGGCQLARATDVSLSAQAGNIYAAPLLNGQPTNMALDTGAEFTTLTRAAAARLGLKLALRPGYAEGIGGTQSVYGFKAKTFQIGRLHGQGFDLMATDMAMSLPGHAFDGLLGADFLAAYDLDLDLPEHKAILYRVLSGCRTPSAALGGDLYEVPLLSNSNINDHRPHIRISIGGKTLTALVDSGAFATTLFRDSGRRVGLNIDQLTTDKHLHVSGVGPRTPGAVRHVVTAIGIGDLTVQNFPVAIVDQRSLPDADMLVGLDFLRRVHAWFSFSSGTLILQYPPLPSLPPPAP